MSFRTYLKLPVIVNLEATDKEQAIGELVQALCKHLGVKRYKPMIDEALRREEGASTFVGQGVAIPQTKGPIGDDFAVAVGRSIAGVSFDAARGALAHIVVLVISNENAPDTAKNIRLLSEISSCFKADLVRDAALSTTGPIDILSIITSFDKTAHSRRAPRARATPDPVLNSAMALARDVKANAILFFADAVRENEFLDRISTRAKRIVVTSNKTRFDPTDSRITALIQAPALLSDRMGQIKIGILLSLSRGLIERSDKLVCVSGNPRSGSFDTVVSIDIEREYEFYFTASHAILPPDVKPEVLERVVGLAGEIAVEGREGKPIGTIFVLGDTNSVNAHVRQLIINPFRGYSESERNIMDPGLDETIKEFALIDGAFIVTGDGIVLSAGSYLRAQAEPDAVPNGLGTRHQAAAAITVVTNALALAISASTGTVTIFKNGQIMMSLSKPVARTRMPTPRIG